MTADKFEYRQDVAFINRDKELHDLKIFVDKRPSEILFLHGPKSSGKTTLLYKFLEKLGKEQKVNVKFLNLRKTFTEFSDEYNYKDFLSVFFKVDDKSEKKGKIAAGINVGLFKINSQIDMKMRQGKVDPFKVMEKEFIRLNKKGTKPILIIDELQALDKIYMDNGRDRRLIIELFNFFVAMTKESHLAHIIIASSDGYFINTLYTDSRLKKSSIFYRVDYLPKEDVMEWLLNLEKYSKIKDYILTKEDAEKIWETVGGSMWEIQDILFKLFRSPLDDVLGLYKKKMRSLIVDYVVKPEQEEIEKLLRRFVDREELPKEEINSEEEKLLRDMVRQNILYFDPTEATYYPQGKSFHHGIRLYFEKK
ncbi:MAG: AAA family ATPase [Candidatus Aminicenantes bacterium]|nr:AAA family ATPase [Candidatus Aminicenantes bacterium]NIM78924.1 AAA family ATPase [Candidatus Aminicenantes bacterium]NIN18184.1 AAA family ATPase [Candidatus Aminicenantes bacterium]NIN42083.1 AAA family ATPase [Candidatus Aminicenantes bacterium]NIN84836.1 AAA family ATPase [Candidatus Aminicenantes bacterium]